MEKDKREKLIRLGRFIRHNRIRKNLSLNEIEKQYSVDKALWSKIENGKLPAVPKPELLRQLSEILDCNCIELYKIVGYLTNSDIFSYISDSHRLRERDATRKTFKP